MFNSVAKAEGRIDSKEKKALNRLTHNSSMLESDLARDVVSAINENLDEVRFKLENDKREIIDGLREFADLLKKKVTP